MTQKLQPNRVGITITITSTQTAAYGLNGFVNGEEIVESRTITSWQGWPLALSVPPFQQDLYGFWFNFGRWSDGGARVHTATTPMSATTYLAYYNPGEKPNWVWLPVVLK
jgi:hypothetical protein